MKILKKSGDVMYFDISKITAALEKAFMSELTAKIDAEQYHKFISIMKKLEWPAYLDMDTAFHSIVVNLFEEGRIDNIEQLIFEHYDHLYLVNLEDQISESIVIKKARFASLSEALLLYQLRYYHGAVAIITPQLIGIVSDLEQYMEEHSLAYNPENILEIESGYGLDLSHEKGRILRALLEGRTLDDEQGEYDSLANYLRFKVFSSRMSNEDSVHHVNRHLLSHGAQVNYGTRHHALRVIMCLDALVWITQVISDEYNAESAPG